MFAARAVVFTVFGATCAARYARVTHLALARLVVEEFFFVLTRSTHVLA